MAGKPFQFARQSTLMNTHFDFATPLHSYMEAITNHITLIRQLSDKDNTVPLVEMKNRFAASQANILHLEKQVEESQSRALEN